MFPDPTELLFVGCWVESVSTQDGQGDVAPKAGLEQAAADTRRSRTCVCANASGPRVALQGEKDDLTSCRGTVQSAWQKPPVRRKGGRAGLPKRCKWPPRGTGTTVPHLSWKCAQVTGNAGENGQNSGEMGGSSPWTEPSAPECLKTLAGDQRPIWGGDRPRRRLQGRHRLGHRPVVLLPPHGEGSMYCQANVSAGKVMRPPVRALPSVIVDTVKVLREADGPVER